MTLFIYGPRNEQDNSNVYIYGSLFIIHYMDKDEYRVIRMSSGRDWRPEYTDKINYRVWMAPE